MQRPCSWTQSSIVANGMIYCRMEFVDEGRGEDQLSVLRHEDGDDEGDEE